MKILSVISAVLVSLSLAPGVFAEIRTLTVSCQDGDTNPTGYIYWDDSIAGKCPGVLVIHEWWRLNDYARWCAGRLAEMGYVAFAVDMYGDDKVTTHPAQANEWLSATVSNLEAWRQRGLQGLEQLRAHELTDTSRVADSDLSVQAPVQTANPY